MSGSTSASEFVFYTDSLLQQLNALFPSRALQTGLVLSIWEQKKADPVELDDVMDKWRRSMIRHRIALKEQRYHEVFADKDILIFSLMDADAMYMELDATSRANLGTVVEYITAAADLQGILPSGSLQGKVLAAVAQLQDPSSVNIMQIAESIANGLTEEETFQLSSQMPKFLENMLSASPEHKDMFGALISGGLGEFGSLQSLQ